MTDSRFEKNPEILEEHRKSDERGLEMEHTSAESEPNDAPEE